MECPEYYPNTEILFMNLANIHSIRKSFQALRLLCNTPNDQVGKHYLNIFLHDGNVFGRVADGVPKKNTRTFSNEKSNKKYQCSLHCLQTAWFAALDATKWLHHVSGLIKAAVRVATALDVEGRPVIVHCSDGWDRYGH